MAAIADVNRVRRIRQGLIAILVSAALASACPTASGVADAAPRSSGPCGDVVQLTNSSFEEPLVSDGSFAILDQSKVPGWSTTASDGKIEIWHGFQGLASADGDQHAELNANEPSTLYQDVPTTPGTALTWSLAHRGREGVDTMAVLIGPPGGALVQQATLTDGQSWGTHTGAYTVPPGQTVTRFAFQAVSTASTLLSIGNLLDAIFFGTQPCPVLAKTVRDLNGGAVEVGDVLEYDVTAGNVGGMPMVDPAIVDAVPNGTEYVPGSMSVQAGADPGPLTDADDTDGGTLLSSPDRVQFTVRSTGEIDPIIAPGTEVEVAWRVKVLAAAAGGQVVNTGQLSYVNPATTQTVSVPTNSVVVDVADAVDLSIDKAPELPVVASGQQIATTLTVTNHGPSAATDVVIHDALVTGASFVSSPDGCSSTDAVTVTCPVGSLAAGRTATRSIVVQVGAGLADGTVVADVAEVASGQHELTPFDNIDNAIAIVAAPSATDTDLAVDIVWGPAHPVAGEPASAVVEVVNAGPEAAENAVLTISLLAGTEITGASTTIGSCRIAGTVATCVLGTLAAGARVDAVVTGTLDSGVPDGATLELRAEVSTTSVDRVAADDVDTASAFAVSPADVAVSIEAAPDPARAGSAIHFPVTVADIGPADARSVTLTVELPPGVLPGAVPGCVAAGRVLTCPVGDLAPGAVRHFDVPGTVDATASGALSATARAAGTSPDLVPGNNTDAVAVTVDPAADLHISKSADPVSAVVGDRTTFTVDVANSGPSAATGVIVVDPLPLGLGTPVVTVTAGTYDAGTGRWTIGNLAASGSARLVASGVTTTAGTLRNDADVSAAQFDPVPDDNTTFALVTVRTILPATGAGDTLPMTIIAAILTAAGIAMVVRTRPGRPGRAAHPR